MPSNSKIPARKRSKPHRREVPRREQYGCRNCWRYRAFRPKTKRCPLCGALCFPSHPKEHVK